MGDPAMGVTMSSNFSPALSPSQTCSSDSKGLCRHTDTVLHCHLQEAGSQLWCAANDGVSESRQEMVKEDLRWQNCLSQPYIVCGVRYVFAFIIIGTFYNHKWGAVEATDCNDDSRTENFFILYSYHYSRL